MKISFIAWARYHRRSEILAQHFGASLHYVYHGQQGNMFQSPFRYLVQTWQTWRILVAERPDIIFVQNPPIFSVLVAFLYGRLHGARYIIDSHTGAFLSRRWRWSVGLHRWLSKAALTTLIHNTRQEALVANWGCRYHVVSFTPGNYPTGEPFSLNARFNVAVISTFEADEPLAAIFQAADCMPDVAFYVTGDPKNLALSLLQRKPENCHLTGFLTYEQYIGLLRGVDTVMDLTTRDHTLLMGGFEAVSLGKPLIVSDWPVLREYFCLGALHIRNTVEGVSNGVRRAQDEQAELQRDILVLRERLDVEWERNFAALKSLLQQSERKVA